jgi:hypothetical protein
MISSKCGLPISSSPSMIHLIVIGSEPSSSRNARIAVSRVAISPLSSLVPRPYNFPSRTSGANGGDSHSSSGSGGCTS